MFNYNANWKNLLFFLQEPKKAKLFHVVVLFKGWYAWGLQKTLGKVFGCF
jgi:hypothetical protein